MNTERPLRELSDEKLLELWKTASMVDDFAHTTVGHASYYDDGLLNSEDIRFIRAGLLLQAKLCNEYNIPYPPMKEDSLLLDDYEEILYGEGLLNDDENEEMEDFEDNILEFMRKSLHETIDAFSSIDGIGDFVEKPMFYDCCAFEYWNDKQSKFIFPDTYEYVEEMEEELQYVGYRSFIREVADMDYDLVDIYEIKMTQSKKIVGFLKARESGVLSKEVIEFWDSFSSKLYRRSYYWIPLDNLEEIKKDTWCCFSAIINHAEESLLNCDLYKLTALRIGAFIAQEFAERYAA